MMKETINRLRQTLAVQSNWTTPELNRYLVGIHGEDPEAVNRIRSEINKTKAKTLWTKRDLEDLFTMLEYDDRSVIRNVDDLALLLAEATPTELTLDNTSNVSNPNLLFSVMDTKLSRLFFIRNFNDLTQLENHMIAQSMRHNGSEVAFVFLKNETAEELGEADITKTMAGIISQFCTNIMYMAVPKERIPSDSLFVVVSSAVCEKELLQNDALKIAYTAYVTESVLDVFETPTDSTVSDQSLIEKEVTI